MGTESKKSRKRIIQLLITMLIISLFLTVGIICSMVLIVSGTYDLKINRDNENLTTLISGNLNLLVDKAYKVTETLVHSMKCQKRYQVS